MADYCSDCSKYIFGEDFGDLIHHKLGWIITICEGCGQTAVNPDGGCKGQCKCVYKSKGCCPGRKLDCNWD